MTRYVCPSVHRAVSSVASPPYNPNCKLNFLHFQLHAFNSLHQHHAKTQFQPIHILLKFFFLGSPCFGSILCWLCFRVLALVHFPLSFKLKRTVCVSSWSRLSGHSCTKWTRQVCHCLSHRAKPFENLTAELKHFVAHIWKSVENVYLGAKAK